MDNSLKGKKLLILGAYKTETEIIKAAQKMGIYTITTDSNTDWNLSPAKFLSDEAWDISWSDFDLLEKKCKENNVDGIMAGFSEKRITCAQKLAERLNKPFYANEALLDVICDKIKFKNACKKSGVVVPKEFIYGEKIDYPVIVKPADNGGSKGISICYSDSELEIAYEKAQKNSLSNSVIIEEYIVADEIMVYFTVHDGIIDFSAMCDRKMHLFDKNVTQLPIAYIFPSKYIEIFRKYNLEKFKKLIENLNIKDGLIAFQSFVKGNDVIPFDPTYRLDGTIAYHIIENKNNINVLNMLIEKSLTGKMGNNEEITKLENPYFETPAIEIPILLKAGTISKIEGLDVIEKMKNVIYIYQKYNIGDTLTKKVDFAQMLCRIHLCGENKEELLETIEKIYQVLIVLDENNNDMIISRNVISNGGL